MLSRYHLGLPMWALKEWVGEFYAPGTSSSDFLTHYSAVFNTVEGNTTFYAAPKPATIDRWRELAHPDFRFCLKFPRTITHDKRLQYIDADLRDFLQLLDPIRHLLGPFFLQLPSGFGPASVHALESFLDRLPRDMPVAVELRHLAFYGPEEAAINARLEDRGVDRITFHTSPLLEFRTDDPEIQESQRSKPRVPPRAYATGRHPFVRFVGPPGLEDNLHHLGNWAKVLAGWMAEGREPYFFVHHAPKDILAPRLARHFHDLLSDHTDVGDLPPFPIDEHGKEQLSLF